nr:hypothetical protein [uncultured Draconibacterium sp.]
MQNQGGVNKRRSKTKTKIASEYNICVATLNNWIETAGIELRKGKRALTPAEVQKLYDHFGKP